ncbi:MAG: DUF721 domain-containing protein [Aeromicrobium sp.]|mgnify:CR=1 FL=1|nr:DUF721 domain-containing protein [Aeromicrobium sp.]
MARWKKTTDIAEALSRVLERADPGGKRHSGAVVSAWKDVVGPEIDRHTRGVALREGGELVVSVDGAGWATQLGFMADDLTRRLNTHVGHTVVTSIRFTVSSRVQEQARWEALEDETDDFYRTDDIEPVPLEENEVAQVEHVAATIDDPRLRAIVARVMRKDLERRKGTKKGV